MYTCIRCIAFLLSITYFRGLLKKLFIFVYTQKYETNKSHNNFYKTINTCNMHVNIIILNKKNVHVTLLPMDKFNNLKQFNYFVSDVNHLIIYDMYLLSLKRSLPSEKKISE